MARSTEEPSGEVTALPLKNRGPDETPLAPERETSPDAASERTESREQDGSGSGAGGAGRYLKRGALAVVLLAVLVAAGWYGYSWWTHGRFIVSTVDAYVETDIATAAPKIGGYVASVPVAENSEVVAGDPLVRLRTTDLDLAVRAARDRIAAAKAGIARLDSQLASARTGVEQANAQQAAAEARAQEARSDFQRTNALVERGVATQAELDKARSARDSAVAELGSATASVRSAEAQVQVVAAQKAEANASLKQARTALAQAKQNRSEAVIRAPFDGVVGNFDVQKGDYVQPGQRLMAVVPVAERYIDANFKETELADIAVGQTVEVEVDAFPGQTFDGEVTSFAPASGAQFSLLPPENATGNFTKVTQRVPVRIHLDGADAKKGVIRPGMSVVVHVDTRTGATTSAEK